MEVHAHPHSPRKKWTHYFWEFLMLFLAVFAGFIAENQREHYVEHQREKTFIKSMSEDVIKDTAMLTLTERRARNVAIHIDTVLDILQTRKQNDASRITMYRTNLRSLSFFAPGFTDRTSSQLKNSGGMRLIRNQKVADSIISYWNQIDLLIKANDLIEEYKMKARDKSYSIFDQKYYTHKGVDAVGVNDPFPKLMTEDNLQLTEYANRLSHIRNLIINVYIPMIFIQKQKAESLIEIIKKEYHLE